MEDRVCVIGVGSQTWRGLDAPEPLAMWHDVVRAAAADVALPGGDPGAVRVLNAVDALEVVYCQTWQYDDAPQRLAARLGIAPRRQYYSGIGGTTPQQLVDAAAARIVAGELDIAVVVSGEALATQKAYAKRGDTYAASYAPDEPRPFPWEAPFHPAEVAHEVFQAWLTFALFDNARRAGLGIGLDDYRHEIARMLAPMTEIAAANPQAWFRTARDVDDIERARPDNRLVGYPYTKYMISVMDVDMAAAVIVASDRAADALGVPAERRIYLRGWCYATDPVYVAEHPDLTASPAMRAATRTALDHAGIAIDDVAVLDLYSCFPSSLHFARDALGLRADDPRPLTVTGGLPYHGGAASGYMTHSIAQTVRVLREQPRGTNALVTGVGMHMTKHVAAVYANAPGPATPPDEPTLQQHLERAEPACAIVEAATGDGSETAELRVATYSVVHGSDGAPEWGVAVCDVADGNGVSALGDSPPDRLGADSGHARLYARIDDGDILREAERRELVGRHVTVRTERVAHRRGERVRNIVVGLD